MAKVKVLYVDQSAGKVDDSLLNELIAEGKIAAFCGSSGWVNVRDNSVSTVTVGQENTNKGGREDESAGNKGNRQGKRNKSWEDEQK